MVQYSYPKIMTGYRWNFLQRCKYELGIDKVGIGDMGEEETVISFDEELTDEQKAILDNIMDNDPQNPNPEWDSVEIVDLEYAAKDMGLMIFYVESVKGSGVYDRIKLCSKTTIDRNKAKEEFSNLFLG